MKTKIISIFLFAIFLIIVTLSFFETNFGLSIGNDIYVNNSPLQVYFIDVSQGDCTLIKCNDECMLIDSGEEYEANTVIDFLKSKDVTTLKYVIATHPHSDHIGGLDEIIKNFEVENIIIPKISYDSEEFEELKNTIIEYNINVIEPKIGDEYYLGDSKFMILSPSSPYYGELNNYSVVVRLLYKDTSFLFTGDIEGIAESEILDNFSNLQSSVLKVAHHGSDTSSTQEFLEAVNPIVSVISVGEDNIYNLPDKDAVTRIEEYSDDVLRTDINGTISIFTDGYTLDVVTSK